MGEKNLIFYIITLTLLSFLFLFSSNFYSWIIKGESVFLDITLDIISRNILSIFGLLLGLTLPISLFKKMRFFISWTLLLFLTFPIIMGFSIKNTYRWIPIGSFTLQPSEIFKIGFLLQISNLLSDKKSKLKLTGFITYTLLSIIILFFIPHFSLIVSLIFVTLSLLFLKGIKLKYFILFLITSIFIFLSLAFIKKGYVIERLKNFKERETSYQVKQAKIAISRGGILGVGVGKGKIKYKFLPDLSKDFIFSLIAEEGGFLGISILIFLYMMIIKSLFDGAILIEDEFYKNYILGVALFTFFNVFVHISVNLGILPVTGVPLPLLSYGGSSSLTYAFLFGSSYKMIKEKNKLKEEKIKILWPRYL